MAIKILIIDMFIYHVYNEPKNHRPARIEQHAAHFTFTYWVYSKLVETQGFVSTVSRRAGSVGC